MGEKRKLEIVALDEFLLSHGELAKRPSRGSTQADNDLVFNSDAFGRLLKRYAGTFVAYQKGILCGQSRDRDTLFREAVAYFGGSSLTVYEVPKQDESLSLTSLNEQIACSIENALKG